MGPMLGTAATFAVSTIYLLWANYRMIRCRHERTRRERVAYLLWVAAHHAA